MDEPIIIKFINGQNQLFTIDEIKILLLESTKKQLFFQFESGEVDEDYRQYLQKELPNYHIFNLRWMPQLWISPAIETSEILERIDEVYEATVSFREDAIRLMQMLGKTYNRNLFNEDRALFKIKEMSRANRQRGKIDEVWNFWFHGAECQFENHKTGQIVETIITNGTEYGALDSFFFGKYLLTTEKFKSLGIFFNQDSASITKALNLLEDAGRLIRINNFSQRGIIAKD
jgi:hypothetical protein